MLRRLFVVDGTTMTWLLLAALADTLDSLCQTYAAGRIGVLTQLFLKAAEPLLVWLFALRWRSEETTKTAVRNLRGGGNTAAAAVNRGSINSEQHDRDDDVNYARSNNAAADDNDDGSVACCQKPACGCSGVSNARLALSLVSLLCVAAGIAAHFALDVKKQHDASDAASNPIGFLVMYCVSVVGSALYAIAFGRYIFLVRRVCAHSEPLDMIDLLRAQEHEDGGASAWEHQVSVVGGVSNRSFQFDPARLQQLQLGARSADAAQGGAGDDAAAADGSVANATRQSLADGASASRRASTSAPVAPNHHPNAVVLDLADDPRDMDVGYQRRSSLTSTHNDDNADHDGDDSNNNWGATAPLHSPYGVSSSITAVTTPPLRPAMSPPLPEQRHHSVGRMSVATSSTVVGRTRNGGGSASAGNGHEEAEKTLAILEQNRSDVAPSRVDVRIVACALETLLALVFSVLLAPALEFIPGDSGLTRTVTMNVSTAPSVNGGASPFHTQRIHSTSVTIHESVTTFAGLMNNTANGLAALSQPSTLLPAAVTLLGWTLVYAADSVLNHLSAPLSSLIAQLATPLTAAFLYAVPAMDASGNPTERFPNTSAETQVLLAALSVLLLLIGSVIMYVAERS